MKKINAVKMVRTIRDRQAKETEGMSVNEMLRYYKAKSATVKTNKTAGHKK